MWMGGYPPLGYDVKDRKLVVNEAEALTVRYIFRRYQELRSVRVLEEHLDQAGIMSKRRTAPDGRPYGGKPIARGALYHMLQNRLYRGEIVHKDRAYPGEQAPIVDDDLWQRVQATLAANRVNRAVGNGSHHVSLLIGLIYDAHGEALTPTHAVKKGVRYRYYVSKSLVTGGTDAARRGQRIPAAHIEALVTGPDPHVARRSGRHAECSSVLSARRRCPEEAYRGSGAACRHLAGSQC
jgi:hypothetical protein